MSREASLAAAAYPNLREAAEILDVPKSTLAYRHVATLRVGREKRFAPRTVLHLATYYHRRPLEEVAADLVILAERLATKATAQQVKAEIATALEETRGPGPEVGLDELSREFDQLLARMQEPGYGRRMRQAFATLTPAEFGRAAVAAARKRRDSVHA